MHRIVGLAFLLWLAFPALAEDAAALAKGLRYNVRVRWQDRDSKKAVMHIELTVANAGRQPVTLEFRTAARVCGELFDSRDRRYDRFPQAAAQVLGTETFPPGKKRHFEHEIPRKDLKGVPIGRNAISAWLCGYDAQRAWAEFPVDPLPRD